MLPGSRPHDRHDWAGRSERWRERATPTRGKAAAAATAAPCGSGEGGGKGRGWPSMAASMPRQAPSQALGAGKAEEVYDWSTGTGHARAQQGTSRALEWSGGASRGGCHVRIRLGRHAHGEGPGATAAGQPLFIRLFIRAGMLSDPPFGGHLPGNSRTREHLCLVLVCLSAPSSEGLHGTGDS